MAAQHADRALSGRTRGGRPDAAPARIDPAETDRALAEYVRPATFPLAVRFARADEVPARARRPAALGLRMPICQMVGMARRYGWTMALGPEEQTCPFGDLALGWAVLGADREELIRRVFPDAQFRLGLLGSMARLEPGTVENLVVAPLARADFEPHLVVVYGRPVQVLRLVQGYCMKGEGPVTSQAGGAAVCADFLARPRLTGRPHYALPCHGDRTFGATQDDEMVFAAPVEAWPAIVEGLAASHRAGLMRYPVTPYLQYEAALPPSYVKLKEALDAGRKGKGRE